jgi:hypothetical protein
MQPASLLMKMTAFWDIVMYSRCNRLTFQRCVLRLSPGYNIPESYHLHTHSRENLKSHKHFDD